MFACCTVKNTLMAYTYIIIGGGASGCVVANRLSANPAHKVLLLESGRKDSDFWIHIPGSFYRVVEKGRDVINYTSTPSDKINGRCQVVPQGKVLGGGSSVNSMCYIRGNKNDYDLWEKLGNTGWSYKDVLPVYKDLENNQRFSDAYHGTSGELKVSDRRYTNALSSAFVKAGQEAGLTYNDDFNGACQDGVGFYQTTTGNAKRCSAATAFLKPIKHRKNLTIRTQCKVAKMHFKNNKAHKAHKVCGVTLESGEYIACAGEIVVCAGAIESPRLLQLSGIGDRALLQQHGIECISDLTGVGENYQDHLLVNVTAAINKPISFYGENKGFKAIRNMLQYILTKTGVMTSTVLETGGFINVSNDPFGADAQFHILPYLLDGVHNSQNTKMHGLSATVCFLRPKSRGSVKIQSADPTCPAVFDAGSLNDDADTKILVAGVQKVLEIFASPSLAQHTKKILSPTQTDTESLYDFVKSCAETVYHPAGTCKMGTADDPMAVVDNTLQVYGVQGLRVCDTSIMPTITSGNTNAPAMMIGEKGARYILNAV